MTRLAKWPRLFVRWAKLLVGRSYYHQPQPVGRAFRAGELAGYFNDLTGKTCWSGLTDEEGVPINLLADGRKVYFATKLVQKALGHWDRWLLTHDEEDRLAFLSLAVWLLEHQDARGGWPVWDELGLKALSPYSAMTQGECISAFVRAWKITGDMEFVKAARRAAELMLTEVEKGGTSVREGDALFLEEVPTAPRSTVLNGWIFAVFGLYDLWFASGESWVQESLQRSIETLKASLLEYDAGYWSFYDRLHHLASPFYHDLHIHQLAALSMVDSAFQEWRERWIAYQKVWRNRVRAFVGKAWQKLRKPGEVVVIK